MPMNSKKQQLGQFMTTNYEYILQGMEIPMDAKMIIEPFCGKGDLLNFVKQDLQFELYDLDPQREDVALRNTLLDPPDYQHKYVLTNPPYLARNKATDKAPFDLYHTNDLFKCFIQSMINNPPDGGIMIIPLNFLSSIRVSDIALRRAFCEVFQISRINIFEERVFADTSYTICAIQFQNGSNADSKVQMFIYPSKKHFETILNEDNNFMAGGEVYKIPDNPDYTIARLTKLNKDQANTRILAKCIDDNANNLLGLAIVDQDKLYVDTTEKLSARTYATLIITPALSSEQQSELVCGFNRYMKTKREQFHSLFLANYRESKDIARKRISFGLVYSICGLILRDMKEANLVEELAQLSISDHK